MSTLAKSNGREVARPRGGASSLGRGLTTLLGVLSFTAFLALMRVVMLYLGPFFLALTKTGIARALSRSPFVVLLVSNALLVALTLRTPLALVPVAHWLTVRVVMLPTLLVCSGLSLAALVAAPPTLEALRERVATRWPERWIASKLANSLDAHFAMRVLFHSIMVVPAFVTMFLPQTRGFWSFAYWGVSLNLIAVSHEALDHSNIHNRFFRTSHLERVAERLLVAGVGLYLEYVLNPICGRMPNWYRVQHVAVHHAEDNGPEDTQSTLLYDRTSYFDAALAAIRYGASMVLPLDVVAYLVRKKRRKPLRRLLWSLAGYYVVIALLAAVYWPSALAIVAMRFVFGHAGTLTYYQWHVFADPADPKNNFRSSMNNADASNDHGYYGAALHIEHHLHQARHWSELASCARDNVSTYEREHVLQLKSGASNVMRALWRRRFDELAPLLVGFDGEPVPRDRLDELVIERTRPLFDEARSPLRAKADELFGRAVATVLV